jgi:hypothetical protein
MGLNPAMGETIKVAAEPPRVDVRTRPLTKAKGDAAQRAESPAGDWLRQSPDKRPDPKSGAS